MIPAPQGLPLVAGIVVVHHNGTLARVIYPPTDGLGGRTSGSTEGGEAAPAPDPRVGVAFWIDETTVMQMAWHVGWIADWYDDCAEEIQLALW